MARRSIGRRMRLEAGGLVNIGAIAVMGKLSSGEEKASGEKQNAHTMKQQN